MAAPDFDRVRLQRTAAAGQGEPIRFVLFGRRWECSPVVPVAAVAGLVELPDIPDKDDPGYPEVVLTLQTAIASFVTSCIVKGQRHDWVAALTAEPIDAETLADLLVWLAGEYRDRNCPTDVPAAPAADPLPDLRTDDVDVDRPRTVDDLANARNWPKGWHLEVGAAQDTGT